MALLTASWGTDAFCLFVGLLTAFFAIAKHVYSYWERKGFKYASGTSYLFGHFSSVVKQSQSVSALVESVYKSTNDAYIGIYSLLKPMLFVRDLKLARNILMRDFHQFSDRGIHCDEEYDPLSGHLFALPFHKWKPLRGKLTPAFTPIKLRGMFSHLADCGNDLTTHLELAAVNNELIDIWEISGCHSTNVIASVVFGLKVNTLENPQHDFRKYSRKMFELTPLNGLRFFFTFVAPKMMRYVGMKQVSGDIEQFVRAVVTANLKYREQDKVVRKDLFQMLVQLRNNGSVQLDDRWETAIKGAESQKSMTLDQMAANTGIFFAAGFETSSSTMSYCLYELAKNPDIQQRVHDEIDRVLAEHGGEISYEAITAMKYLDNCFDETLRKYAIVPLLNRVCVEDYKIESTGQVIEKGVNIVIPVFAMQRDEQYYPDPLKFDPDRFNESSGGRNPGTRPYMPFGDGPRNCIGLRLGKIQTKVGLVTTLRKFSYSLQPEDMNKEIEMSPKAVPLTPLKTIYLRIAKRDSCVA